MNDTRISHWRRILEQARTNNPDWVNSGRIYTKLTAKQTCSDIRAGRRIQGIQPNELFDADYRPAEQHPGEYEVFVRLTTPT